MFSIRQLFSILTIIAIVILLGGLQLARSLWFYPLEMQLYMEQLQTDLESVSGMLELQQEQLLTNVIDYSHREDVRKFALTADKPSNIDPMISNNILQLDIVLFINKNKELVLAQRISVDDSNAPIIDTSIAKWYEQAGYKVLSLGNAAHHSIIDANNKIYFLASTPVYQHNSHIPDGWLVFLEQITTSTLEEISLVTQLTLVPLPVPQHNDPYIPPLSMPIYEVTNTPKRCIYNPTLQPIYCFAIEHSRSFTMPKMFDYGLLLTYLLVLLVPIFIFSALLNTLAKPLLMATETLQQSRKDGSLLPLSMNMQVPIRELDQLRIAYNELVNLVQRQHHKLENLSLTDRLTEISNRRAFDISLDIIWRRLVRRKESIALVIIDIDFFKLYNDYYGHPIGDRALISVALALKSCARRADEVAARIGGEEFALILQVDDENNMSWLRERLENVVSSLEIPHEASSISDHLSISIGISWIPESGPWLEKFTAQHWLQDADVALYTAKETGRNRSYLHTITPTSPIKDLPE